MSGDGSKSDQPSVAGAMGNMQVALGGAAAAAQSAASQAPGDGAKSTGVGADLKRIIKEVSQEARKSKVPLYIAILAACLALVSMAEGDVKERALGAQIEASNKWAYFQAKNIRKTNSETAAEILESLGKPALAQKWRDTATRYGNEKDAIKKEARNHEEIRALGLKQSGYFEISIALLQIAIVLATAALILGGGLMLSTSILFAALAMLFTFNGYYLYFEIPTDPVMFGKWLTTHVSDTGWLKGTN